MRGGKNRGPLGYTIIEVMIVLAVSGVMFLIAANFINGKQARTAFTEGVNDTASRIQSIIEQVRNGQYSDINFSCSVDSVTGAVSVSSLNPQQQGSNSPCVFMGKFLYFSYDGAANSSPHYAVYTLVGRRLDASKNPTTNPTAARTTIVDNPNLTTQETTAQSLNIYSMKINGGTGNFGIGFLQTPATDNSSNLVNGGSTANPYYLLWLPPGRGLTAVKGPMRWGWSQVSSASICLTDGTRYGEIQLGTNGGQLTVDVKMDGTTQCV